MATCIGPECVRDVWAKGMCFAHYKQVHFDGKQELTKLRLRMKSPIEYEAHCIGPECKREVHYANLCSSHLAQKYRKGVLSPLRVYSRPNKAQEGA